MHFGSLSNLHIKFTIFIVSLLLRNPIRSGSISRFEIKKAIPLLERKGYTKAIRELEMVLGIPRNISLFQSI